MDSSPDTPPTADRPPSLTSAEVTERIRRCLTAGRIAVWEAAPTKHFSDQRSLRDYAIQEALNVLRCGEVSSEAPEWNDTVKRWAYRVHGPDLEGDVLTVVVGIGPERDRVWLVTAF